jgi:hypothetical protein
MPRTTHRFPFELLVLQFAADFARRFSSPESKHTFLLTLDGQGNVTSLSFSEPPSGWSALLDELKAKSNTEPVSYFFYDPFDAPEYTCISWLSIQQSVMERLMAHSFTAADFDPLSNAREGSELPAPGRFPETWSVIF